VTQRKQRDILRLSMIAPRRGRGSGVNVSAGIDSRAFIMSSEAVLGKPFPTQCPPRRLVLTEIARKSQTFPRFAACSRDVRLVNFAHGRSGLMDEPSQLILERSPADRI